MNTIDWDSECTGPSQFRSKLLYERLSFGNGGIILRLSVSSYNSGEAHVQAHHDDKPGDAAPGGHLAVVAESVERKGMSLAWLRAKYYVVYQVRAAIR